MKRFLSAVLIAILLLTLTTPAATAADGAYGIHYPTREQIVAKIKEVGIDLSAPMTYDEPYSLESPDYAPGKLTADSQQQALNLLNLYRYIAGLPSDVKLSDDYCKAVQAAALINAANNSLSHTPKKPEGMDDALYQLGYQTAGESNLSIGYSNMKYAMVKGLMNDSSASNIRTLGHRRWILNPSMQYTGFGAVKNSYAMYAFDRSRSGRFTGDYVAWPAPNTPIEMFAGSVFSITLGSAYDAPSAEKVSITLTSETLGKSWTVNRSNPELAFYVNNDGYGMPKCIIFKVADFIAEDRIRVTVNGITKKGVAAPIDYTVNLFNLSDINVTKPYLIMRPYRLYQPDVTATSLLDSEPVVSWLTTDSQVADMYANGLFSYVTGEATLTAAVGGKSVDITVISSYDPILLGDADKDGSVDLIDVTTIQRVLSNVEVESFRKLTADADGDDMITALDATYIQRKTVGMETPYTVGEAMH